MHDFWRIAIPLLATAAIIVAFGEGTSHAMGGGKFGEPGFDSTTVVAGRATRVTGASFVKVGTQFFDVNTLREISQAEAAARAVAEGQALP